MSLINDALRDLDSRERSSELEHHDYASATLAPQIKKSTKPLLFAAVIFAAGFGAYKGASVVPFNVAAEKEALSLAASDSVSAPSEVSVASSAEKNVSPENSQTKRVVHTPSSMQSIAMSVEEGVISERAIPERAEQLLLKAETAIARNRLSLPAQGSALYFLDQVTLLFPQHTEVKARAATIRAEVLNRYRAQLDNALANKNYTRAAFLLSRSAKFGLSSEQKRLFEQTLADIRPSGASSLSQSSSSPQQGIVAVRMHSEVVEESGGSTNEIDGIKSEAHSGSSGRESKQQAAWVTLTSKSQELAVIAKAQAHLTGGAQREAEKILSDYLAGNPASIEARAFLFDHYMTTHRVDKAQLLLSTLPEGHALVGYFNAQIANTVHGPERAIEILVGTEPDARVATQYRALLAGLYQKTSRHEDAFSLYRALLREDENNLVALLGFALSADHLGDAPASLAAYRRIMQLGHPNERVQRYVEKRINTLQNNDLAEATPW